MEVCVRVCALLYINELRTARAAYAAESGAVGSVGARSVLGPGCVWTDQREREGERERRKGETLSDPLNPAQRAAAVAAQAVSSAAMAFCAPVAVLSASSLSPS